MDGKGIIGTNYKARPVHFFYEGVTGRTFAPVSSEIGSFATPICFDCGYTSVCLKMVGLGAGFFAVHGYDSKSWSRAQHLQRALMFSGSVLRKTDAGCIVREVQEFPGSLIRTAICTNKFRRCSRE